MTSSAPRQSIHQIPPLERGGVLARLGFDVQDHVAAAFFLTMIETQGLLQVWCETHDDITLIWQKPLGEEIEFVQVKSNELDQLWTIAKLCEREKGEKKNTSGTSIFERSLANDRCLEPCRFRLVTCRPVQADLRLLTLESTSPDRLNKAAELNTLSEDIQRRTDGFVSKNGNGPAFWLDHLLWEERHSLETIRKDNLDKLRTLIEQQGEYLFRDQMDDLYSGILTKVRTAAVSAWGVDPRLKKLLRQDAIDWLKQELAKRTHSAPTTAGTNLRTKMESAKIIEAEIASSLETRRRYLAERLQPQYLSLSERGHVEGEVAATLHALRTQLDAGELPDAGVDFHAKCIHALQELRDQLQTSRPVPLAFLFGCMYSIADRCTHRFRRATA